MNHIRITLSTLFVASILMFSALPASATESQARKQLESTINAVLTELDDPALHQPAGREAVLGRVEKIITGLFDFSELSSRTVGPSWKTFTDDQRKRFTEAFTTLLRENYLEKFDGYNGEQVEYLSESQSSDGKRVEIQTRLAIKNKPVSVNYRMLQKSQWVVYDVVIEGVSMVQNFRSQFQSVLTKGDAEELISLVIKKGTEAKNFNAKQQVKQ